jgi:hypothetical protein
VSSSRVLTGLALVAVALATALAVVALGWEGDREDETQGGTLPTATSPTPTPDPDTQPGTRPEEPRPAIAARGTMSPRIVLFGDIVRARVDVIVDAERVDPDSVRVAAAFSPWEVVGQPEQVRREADETTILRTTYVLRCFTSPCLPPGDAVQLEFDAARVTYERARDEAAEGVPPRQSLRITWPVVTLYSRYASASFTGREGLTTPWRADLATLPAVGYRVAPGLVLALLLAAGVLLAGAGGFLVYRAWPRRVPAPPPEPEPLPPPLPPLLLALVLLEDAARADGAEDRRRALELVAEALTEHGDEDLAHSAKILAWSEADPEVEDTTELAARVRATLVVEEEPLHGPEENGRVA